MNVILDKGYSATGKDLHEEDGNPQHDTIHNGGADSHCRTH